MDIKSVKVEVLLPEEYIEQLRNELNKLGVLTVIMTMLFLILLQRDIGDHLTKRYPMMGKLEKFHLELNVSWNLDAYIHIQK